MLRRFVSTDRQRDKGHCKILFEDDDEHEDMDEFYDFNKEMLPDGSIVTKSESTAMVVKYVCVAFMRLFVFIYCVCVFWFCLGLFMDHVVVLCDGM